MRENFTEFAFCTFVYKTSPFLWLTRNFFHILQIPGFLNQFKDASPKDVIVCKEVGKFPTCSNDISFWLPENHEESYSENKSLKFFACDVFGKGQHFSLLKLDVKTKTASEVEFSSGGNSYTESS